MGFERKQYEPEEEQGAPEWMLTFSDCMTLLLTFFVLLLSFSSFDDKIFIKLKVMFSQALPTISKETDSDKDALLAQNLIVYGKEVEQGSEKQTFKIGKIKNIKRETEPKDFLKRKVFSMPSQKIFWGRGSVISAEGEKILSAIATYLKEMPNKIVISENEQNVEDEISKLFGLHRAWSVMNYFVQEQNLNNAKFCISATSTLALEKNYESKKHPNDDRILEVILLERSICN